MAYIHVKKIGKVNYYTLRISFREGNKVITRDLENLGNDINKISIEDLEKRHRKEIRKSYRTIKRFLDSNYYLNCIRSKKLKKDSFLTKEQLEKVEAIRLHYNSRFQKIDESSKNDIYEGFLIKFAVNSTSIEGNTITLKEADRLLREGIVPKGRTLREVYDLQNTKEAFYELLGSRKKINNDFITGLHDSLLKNIDERKGYRRSDINIFGQPFKPTPGRYVEEDMNLLLNWLKKNMTTMHPVALVALFHHKFESIHPFFDGNGRTGRMLMNYILIRNNCPPLVISRRFRKEYLEHMSKSDKGLKKDLLDESVDNYKDLIGFIVSQLEESYWDTFLI